MFNLAKTFGKLKTVLLASACLWSIPNVTYAESMETSIQEAIYLFEMKGEVAESIRILEDVAKNGTTEDKENAYFYLGKIQELAGNKTSSNFYYQQSLERTSETSKAYWLAERDAATSVQAEKLLRSPLPLKSSIQRTFSTNPTYLLLQDGSVKKIEDDKLVNVPTGLSGNASIVSINNKGIWYQNEEKDSLNFKPFLLANPSRTYAISNITSFLEYNEEAVALNDRYLTILGKKDSKIQIPEKYNGCHAEGFFKPAKEFILNCPDNAVHFIAADDGTETRTIAQFDVIQKILLNKNYLFLVSGNYLYGYLPKKSVSPLWKISVSNVESLFMFEKMIAILEASGTVALIDQGTGYGIAKIRSDATALHPLAQGTLGLFTGEGAITAVDTLLRPIWHFNFAKPIEQAPIYTNGNTYLYFGDKKLQAISPRYYGKKDLMSDILARKAAIYCEKEQWEDLQPVLDTLFRLEPGNAEGWFFKALFLEKNNGSERDRQKAWSEAVRLSVSNPQVTQLILNRYSKAIGARFVSLLPISPKTRYPQFFSGKRNLYSIDPAAERLLCINAENGEIKWSRNIGKLDNSPVIGNDDNTLVIASGYDLSILDLNRENQPTSIKLPGKAFEAKISENAIYVSTWNGFLLKILKQENKLAWSRKIFAVPFLMAKTGKSLHLCNLEGELVELDDGAGQTKEGTSNKLQSSISHIVGADSMYAIATTNNRLFIFNQKQKDKAPSQILMESPIASLEIIADQNEHKFVIGLADQSILLYSENGAPLWKFQGHNSIFTKPYIKDGEAWIDQGNEVVAISLKTGKPTRKFNTPGGAGSPFVMNGTLFSASPKRLLYGFSL